MQVEGGSRMARKCMDHRLAADEATGREDGEFNVARTRIRRVRHMCKWISVRQKGGLSDMHEQHESIGEDDSVVETS